MGRGKINDLFFCQLQIEKIAKEELKKYVQKKTEELVRLETEYQNALRDIGLGHEGVKEHVRVQIISV